MKDRPMVYHTLVGCLKMGDMGTARMLKRPLKQAARGVWTTSATLIIERSRHSES